MSSNPPFAVGAIAFTFFACLSSAAAQPRSRLAELSISGAEIIPSDDIKAAFHASRFPVDIHNTEADESLQVVRSSIEAVYHFFGRRLAQVGAKRKGAIGVITIDEGELYVCGMARVAGADGVPLEEFHNLIVEGDGTIPAVWPHGGRPPADIRYGVKRALWTVGYQSEDFSFRLVPVPGPIAGKSGEHPLDLLVAFQRPPQAITIAAVSTVGQRRNSDESIRKLLGIPRGSPARPSVLLNANRRLLDCGRFRHHEIDLINRPELPNQVFVRVAVEELPVTPLGQPLNDVEEALLKASKWLGRNDKAQRQVSLRDGQFEMIASAKGGVALVNHAAVDGAPPSLAAFSRSTGTTLYNCSDRQRLTVPTPKLSLRGRVKVEPLPGPETWKFKLNLSYEATGSASRIDFDVSTPALLCLADGARSTWNGEWLRLTTPALDMEVNAVTGEIRHMQVGAGQNRYVVSFPKGRLEELERELKHVSRRWPNRYDRAAPVTSLVSFATRPAWRDLLKQAQLYQAPEYLEALGELSQRGVFREFDKIVAERAEGPVDAFGLLLDMLNSSSQEAWALVFIDRFFERGSWPWLAARSYYFRAIGRRESFQAASSALQFSEQAGPLATMWGAACLASVTDNEHARRTAGRLIVARSDLKSFRKEYQVLLDRRTPVGRFVWRLASALKQMDGRHVDALTAAFPEVVRDHLRVLLGELRWHADDTLDFALPRALDRMWEAGARRKLADAAAKMFR